jgi:hypothetical protein
MLLFYGIVLIILIPSGIAAWITAYRMRRKIKNTLGRKASKGDLTSMSAWMSVDEAEQASGANKPRNPS